MKSRMSDAVQSEIWDRYENGENYTDIGTAVGRSLTTVRSFVMRHDYKRPQVPTPWSSARLSLLDREEISRQLVAGYSFRAIARMLGRAPSTISREVNVNGGRQAYRAVRAETSVRKRVKRPRAPKLAESDQLRRLVEAKLAELWSPEQIAGWLRSEFPTEPSMWIGHEAIYRAIYAHDVGVLDARLWRCLRTRRAARRARRRRGGRGQGVIKKPILITERPRHIDDRVEVGHWEGDLIVGKRCSALATLVERRTRFVVLATLPGGRTAELLNTAVSRQLSQFPPLLQRSLTWDQGKEIAGHEQLRARLRMDVYLCQPNIPWQRGTNENTNGLLRQYLPRSTDFYALTQANADQIAASLNNRPRHTLDWQTPATALHLTLAT